MGDAAKCTCSRDRKLGLGRAIEFLDGVPVASRSGSTQNSFEAAEGIRARTRAFLYTS